MRDLKRIERVLSALRDVWYANPDLRLAQIVCNCAYARTTGTALDKLDPFHMDDDELVRLLKEVY